MAKKTLTDLTQDLLTARDALQSALVDRIDGKTDSEIAAMLKCDRGHANWVKRKLRTQKWTYVDALVKHAQTIGK